MTAREALVELDEKISPGVAVLFFLAASAAASLIVKLTPEQTASFEKLMTRFPHMANPLFWKVIFIPISLVWVSWAAFCLHFAADMNGAEAPFHKLWKAVLLLTAIQTLLYLALPSVLPTRVALAFGKGVFICVAMAGIYSLSAGRVILSYILGMVASLVVLFVVLFTIIILAAIPLAKKAQGNLAQPVLSPVHMPAEYAWVLQKPDGSFTKMAPMKGHVTVLNFWATWCAPCRAEMPSLQHLYGEVHGNGVEVLGVSTERSEQVKQFLQKKNFSFPIYSHASPLPPIFESTALPTTFILSEDGYIVAMLQGAANWADPAIVSYLNSLKGKHFEGGELSLGKGTSETADLLVRQAAWEDTHGQNDRAIEFFRKGLDLLSKDPIPRLSSLGSAYNGLGNAYYHAHHYAEAVQYHLQAITALKKVASAAEVIIVLHNAEHDYRKMNQTAEANRMVQDIRKLEVVSKN